LEAVQEFRETTGFSPVTGTSDPGLRKKKKKVGVKGV